MREARGEETDTPVRDDGEFLDRGGSSEREEGCVVPVKPLILTLDAEESSDESDADYDYPYNLEPLSLVSLEDSMLYSGPPPPHLALFDTTPISTSFPLPPSPPPLPLPHLPPSVIPPLPPSTTTASAASKTKKLSKHYFKKSSKYAPGDYTEVPMPRPLSDHAPSSKSSVEAGSTGHRYKSYLISGCLDHRLHSSLEYPVELGLQRLVQEQYQAVMTSLVTATPPSAPPPVGSGGEGVRREGGEGVTGGLGEVCAFVCKSLEDLLDSTTQTRPGINLVSLLQFWMELNSLLPPRRPPGRPGGSLPTFPGVGGATETIVDPPHLLFGSTKILTTLIECLSHAPCDHAHSRDATWQIGLALVHQFVRHLSTDHTPSHPPSLPLHPSQLSQFLLAYFLSGDGPRHMGVARGVVSNLLKELVPLSLMGVTCEGVTSEGGEGVKGAHVLLQVLLDLLEKR